MTPVPSYEDTVRDDELKAIGSHIALVMGRAMAAVMLGKDKSKVSETEALKALGDYAQLPEDDETRNRALRAGWLAVLYNNDLRHAHLFPAGPAMDLAHALGALDAGVTRGVAAPVENSRRASADDYDTLAKVLAMEVIYHRALLDLEHNTDAVALVTGVSNPDTPRKKPAPGAATIPMPSRTWEQVISLFKRGRALIGENEAMALRVAGIAVRKGAEPEDVLFPEHLRLREAFAAPVEREGIIQRAFAVSGAGRKRRRKPSAKTN